MMNPRPNAAPRMPKFLARFSLLLMSPTAALATAMLPPVSPSSARDTKRSGMFAVAMPMAKMKYPIAVPNTDRASTGLRPWRSDNWPRIGAARKMHSGYTPCNQPSMIRPLVNDQVSGVTLKGVLLMRSGKTGMRMLKPSRSMKTVENSARRGLRRIARA